MTAVQGVRAILGEPDDVRDRLATGKLSRESRDAGTDEHEPQPDCHPRIKAGSEEVGRQRSWCNEEGEDPEWPVIEPVIEFVARAQLALGIELDAARVRLCLH